MRTYESVAEARQHAARIAARANLMDVRALSLGANLDRDPSPGSTLSYDVGHDVKLQWEQDDPQFFAVRVEYDVTLKERSDTEGDEADEVGSHSAEVFATLKFELAALCQLEMREDDDPPLIEELEAYAQSTGVFALFPYARETASTLSGRLGLPPLTLGVYREETTRP